MKRAFSYILTVVLVVVTAWIILSNIKPSQIPYLLYNTNRLLLFLAVACMLLFWIMDASIIRVIAGMIGIEFSLRRSLKLTLIGQYYTEITPYAIGCQPAQIYTMMNYSVPLGKATSIVIDKFVIYQIVVTFYSVAALIFRHDFIYSITKGLFSVLVSALLLHLLGTLAIIILFLNPKIVEIAILHIISLLHRFRVVRNVDAANEKAMAHLKEYSDSIDIIRGSWGALFITVIMSIVEMSAYFAIAYFIFRGLRVSSIPFVDVMTLQSLLYMIVAIVPTPGTIGASEGGFFLLFKGLASASIMPYATLLWSLINYYMNLVTGGIVTFVSNFTSHRRHIRKAR